MNLREAAQQALDYLEQHAIISGIPIRDALRAALEPVTACHELSKEGDKLSLPFNHFPDVRKMVATCQESRQVEPVAWMQIGVGDHEGTVIVTTTEPKTWNPAWWKFEPLYTAPPASTWTDAHWTEYERGIVATERERIAAWVEDMCVGLDAKTIANGIRNGGNDDIRAFEVRK